MTVFHSKIAMFATSCDVTQNTGATSSNKQDGAPGEPVGGLMSVGGKQGEGRGHVRECGKKGGDVRRTHSLQ